MRRRGANAASKARLSAKGHEIVEEGSTAGLVQRVEAFEKRRRNRRDSTRTESKKPGCKRPNVRRPEKGRPEHADSDEAGHAFQGSHRLNEADFVGGGVSRKSLTSDGVSRLITFLMSFGFSRPALVGDRHQWSENAARREPKIRWPNLAEPRSPSLTPDLRAGDLT